MARRYEAEEFIGPCEVTEERERKPQQPSRNDGPLDHLREERAQGAGSHTDPEHPHKLLKSVGGEGTGVIPTTDVARIRAFRDFLSEDEADDRLRRQEIAGRTKSPWKLTS
jgi:hypothetical protein